MWLSDLTIPGGKCGCKLESTHPHIRKDISIFPHSSPKQLSRTELRKYRAQNKILSFDCIRRMNIFFQTGPPPAFPIARIGHWTTCSSSWRTWHISTLFTFIVRQEISLRVIKRNHGTHHIDRGTCVCGGFNMGSVYPQGWHSKSVYFLMKLNFGEIIELNGKGRPSGQGPWLRNLHICTSGRTSHRSFSLCPCCLFAGEVCSCSPFSRVEIKWNFLWYISKRKVERNGQERKTQSKYSSPIVRLRFLVRRWGPTTFQDTFCFYPAPSFDSLPRLLLESDTEGIGGVTVSGLHAHPRKKIDNNLVNTSLLHCTEASESAEWEAILRGAG